LLSAPDWQRTVVVGTGLASPSEKFLFLSFGQMFASDAKLAITRLRASHLLDKRARGNGN
jgi:hypothetical protein